MRRQGPGDGGRGRPDAGRFEHFGLDRVDLSCDHENERSSKIPRKLGFVEEGRLR
jgi:ribosomal protein S18 acetylase RimI-like enzyme